MSEQPICPCGPPPHPLPIENLPGLSVIRCRVGDFDSFRRALLVPREGEQALSRWVPNGRADLAVQLVEWWAYLADVLTFYNERIAENAYLRTARLPGSVERLVRLLGHRPRPGIGGWGYVAALVSAKTSITVPKGFAIQSKPAPGKKPQTFEVSASTRVSPGGTAAVTVFKPTKMAGQESVVVEGTITSLTPGDLVLIASRSWKPPVFGPKRYAVATVKATAHEKDPYGKTHTRVTFTQALPGDDTLPGYVRAYQLFRPAQKTGLFRTSEFANPHDDEAVLPGRPRELEKGSRVLFDSQLFVVKSYQPTMSVTGIEFPPIFTDPPYPTATVNTTQPLDGITESALVRFDFREVGPLVDEPVLLVTGETVVLSPAAGSTWIPPGGEFPVIVEDATGEGVLGVAGPPDPTVDEPSSPGKTLSDLFDATKAKSLLQLLAPAPPPAPATTLNGQIAAVLSTMKASPSSPGTLQAATPSVNQVKAAMSSTEEVTDLQIPLIVDFLEVLQKTHLFKVRFRSPVSLVSPLKVYTNVLPITRGKTVAREVLGSGDASRAGQSFALAKSPLTYLAAKGPDAQDGYESTLTVHVNGVAWREVPTFHGQPGDARVFVTREDEKGVTHVMFGDGVNGAHLPSGAGNVVATYRHESGLEVPARGTLATVVKPYPGVQAIKNPLVPMGGDDPDPPGAMRWHAPRSVLTFGRAIAGDDYEAIAARAPSVKRAKAVYGWDGATQRALVKVYVGDDAGAVAAARAALQGMMDPHRPLAVELAKAATIKITLTLAVDPRYEPGAVVEAVRAALLDPDTGLLGENVPRIGQPVYRSQIHDACLRVPGAVAVTAMSVWTDPPSKPERHFPGESRYYRLLPEHLVILPEVATDV